LIQLSEPKIIDHGNILDQSNTGALAQAQLLKHGGTGTIAHRVKDRELKVIGFAIISTY
jgi:hypothetical protein